MDKSVTIMLNGSGAGSLPLLIQAFIGVIPPLSLFNGSFVIKLLSSQDKVRKAIAPGPSFPNLGSDLQLDPIRLLITFF